MKKLMHIMLLKLILKFKNLNISNGRSVTKTYSTIINFSIKDFLQRVDRIAAINDNYLILQFNSFYQEKKRNYSL